MKTEPQAQPAASATWRPRGAHGIVWLAIVGGGLAITYPFITNFLLLIDEGPAAAVDAMAIGFNVFTFAYGTICGLFGAIFGMRQVGKSFNKTGSS